MAPGDLFEEGSEWPQPAPDAPTPEEVGIDLMYEKFLADCPERYLGKEGLWPTSNKRSSG